MFLSLIRHEFGQRLPGACDDNLLAGSHLVDEA
jgi:hypothetical protein